MFLADAGGFFFIILIIGGVIALIAWSIHHQKKIRENWMRFAVHHGLSNQGTLSRPHIQGWMGPIYVTLKTEVRGSGKSRTTYTQFHATTNVPMPHGMNLYKEGFFSGVGKMLGGQDIQVGDAALDAAFIIKGNDALGIHNLLRLEPVKKALLYVVARNPQLRVNERALLVEHTGMTGDLAKLEAVFADLTYLAQTLDAGYQELVAASAPRTGAPSAGAKSAGGRPPAPTSKAAAAEILGASFFQQPNVRQAGPGEDPATRKQALTEMADVLNQFGAKQEAGEVESNVLTNFARADSMEGKASNAFHSNADPGDVFAATPVNTASAFEVPKNEDAFADPKPFEAPEKSGGATASDFDGLMAMLGDSSLMSSDREGIIERHGGRRWAVEFVVDRVDNTWGFDVPDALRDGKTVEGHAGERKLAVRFPKDKNAEIGGLRSGASLKAQGKLAAWDDLFKKATLDVG